MHTQTLLYMYCTYVHTLTFILMMICYVGPTWLHSCIHEFMHTYYIAYIHTNMYKFIHVHIDTLSIQDTCMRFVFPIRVLPITIGPCLWWKRIYRMWLMRLTETASAAAASVSIPSVICLHLTLITTQCLTFEWRTELLGSASEATYLRGNRGRWW